MLDFTRFCIAFFGEVGASSYTIEDMDHLQVIYDKLIVNPNYADENVAENVSFLSKKYEKAAKAIVTLANMWE